MTQTGTVQDIYRYPVKSMGGETCPYIDVHARGIADDRIYAVRTADGKFGSGKSTRRFARLDGLLNLSAAMESDVCRVSFPDGRRMAAGSAALDEALSEVCGQPVTVAKEGDVPHFDDGPVHVVTTASLRWLQEQLPDICVDARRFRPNLVVACDGSMPVEQGWIGKILVIGDVRLRMSAPTERCVMVTMPQPGLDSAPEILRTLAQECDVTFGVYAEVLKPGRVSSGARVQVE